MAYQEALEAAGATVHKFEQFGSYQGDWWAKVTLPDGRTGWINGSYGSCSGCDAFEAEFGYEDENCEAHRWGRNRDGADTCEACKTVQREHAEKLARFGQEYLDSLLTQAEAEAAAAKNLDWDSDAQGMLDFIRSESATSADAVDPVDGVSNA